MICAGCNRELEVGDRYIEDTTSGFLKMESTPEIDEIIASIFPGSGGSKIVVCEDCTAPGGDYMFEMVYGDESADSFQEREPS